MTPELRRQFPLGSAVKVVSGEPGDAFVGALGNAPFDGARCDESMKVCSEGEERALQAYFDCLDRLPVCTPETKPQFNEAVLACASGMQALSPGCFVP